MGFLVLLNTHKGDEDIARLADDLDLEIDEIVPAAEFSEVLGLVHVVDGRATLTDFGRQVLAGSIRERKRMLREQLRRTTLFKALMRALDRAPAHTLSADQAERLVAFTTTPADEYVQNIINWGRFVELFRYDAQTGMLTAFAEPPESEVASRPPKTPPLATPPSRAGRTRATEDDAGGRPAERAVSSVRHAGRAVPGIAGSTRDGRRPAGANA